MNFLSKIFKPLFSKITCHCIGSVGLGIMVAAVLAFAIINWSGFEETTTVTATYNIHLPQDGEMLKKLSDEILEGTDVTNTEDLTDIAPAAGNAAVPAE